MKICQNFRVLGRILGFLRKKFVISLVFQVKICQNFRVRSNFVKIFGFTSKFAKIFGFKGQNGSVVS